MDWIWSCVKEFLFWTGVLVFAAGLSLGGMLVYDAYHVPSMTLEIVPIKLQMAGPSALSM